MVVPKPDIGTIVRTIIRVASAAINTRIPVDKKIFLGATLDHNVREDNDVANHDLDSEIRQRISISGSACDILSGGILENHLVIGRDGVLVVDVLGRRSRGTAHGACRGFSKWALQSKHSHSERTDTIRKQNDSPQSSLTIDSSLDILSSRFCCRLDCLWTAVAGTAHNQRAKEEQKLHGERMEKKKLGKQTVREEDNLYQSDWCRKL